MTRGALFELHQNMCAKALELMRKKNADYAKNGPFDNFKLCEAVGMTSAEKGILIRMLDKLSRLSSVLDKGAQVDESVEDTLLDIINYSICIAGLQRERQTAAAADEPADVRF